ncbi:MAG: glycosyltransferase family 39 protein [Actinomycetota bacterium]|nr:glycosyltransferase family 39 protein [Actinomycetota bacterium]
MASNGRALSRWSPASENALLAYLALAKLLVHLLTNGNYGYFRDEFYYVAAGERLNLGYVDFPPFVAIVADVSRFLLGDSPVALRFFPALAGALVVVLAGLMARELGGGRFAQGLAALATLVAPNFLAMGTFLSMDAFDQLFWVSATYILLLILKQDRPRLWLLFGLIVGLGLLTKVTMLFFGFAVFLALLLSPARRHLRTPWPWVGGVIAFAFLLPYVFWQIEHGWPTLEFWANYGGKVDPASPVEFLLEQVVTMHPLTLPIWLAGLYYYLFSSAGRPYRPLGLIYVVLLVLFMVQNAKFYFLAPVYPVLFAAGAMMIERFVQRRGWGWIKPTYAAILVIGGMVVAPLVAVPALPVEMLAKITGAAGGDAGVEVETREVGQLPQQFADRFGWETMVATVAGVYRDLPPEERAESCIFTGNYGEAGAIDFFGPQYDLPKAISGHNNYYIWGPGDCTGQVIISVGVPLSRLEVMFDEVEQTDTSDCEYCMPDEDNLPIYVGRSPKASLQEMWPQVKHYN